MTDLRKAAEMALDALTVQTPEHWLDKELQDKAIQALRQALAQPKQEPVAWSDVISDGGLDPRNAFNTAPPKREWVGVTYDEVYEFVCTTDSYINLAKAIEAKLKEKNT